MDLTRRSLLVRLIVALFGGMAALFTMRPRWEVDIRCGRRMHPRVEFKDTFVYMNGHLLGDCIAASSARGEALVYCRTGPHTALLCGRDTPCICPPEAMEPGDQRWTKTVKNVPITPKRWHMTRKLVKGRIHIYAHLKNANHPTDLGTRA